MDETLLNLFRFSVYLNIFLIFLFHAYLHFCVYKKFRANHSWMAFLPIYPFHMIPLFSIIGKSGFRCFLWLVPGLNIYVIFKDLKTFFEISEVSVVKSMLLSIFIPFGYLIVLGRIVSKDAISPPVRQAKLQPQAEVGFEEEEDEGAVEELIEVVFYKQNESHFFVKKWLKDNLEMYIKNGLELEHTYIYPALKQLKEYDISFHDVERVLRNKEVKFGDYPLLLNATDGVEEDMQEVIGIYKELLIAIYESSVKTKDEKKATAEFLKKLFKLIQNDLTKDSGHLMNLLFEPTAISGIAKKLKTEEDVVVELLQKYLS